MLLGVLGQSRAALHTPASSVIMDTSMPGAASGIVDLLLCNRTVCPSFRGAVMQTSASELLTSAPSSLREKEGVLPMLHRMWK